MKSVASGLGRARQVPWGVVVPAAFLILLVFSAVFSSLVAPFDPNATAISLRNNPPLTPSNGWIPHLLGTDPLGRDVLSRMIYGCRVSIAVSVSSVILSGVGGTIAGIVAGYFRGTVEAVIMRLVDVQMSIPTLLVALLFLYVLGPSVRNVVLVLALTRWMVYARVARGMALSLCQQPFVEASRALGAGPTRIMTRHLMPNMLGTLLTLGTLEMALVLLTEASLDFLGLGIQPPASSWGLMLSDAQEYLTSAWWLSVFPGIVILLTALCMNVLARGLGNTRSASRL